MGRARPACWPPHAIVRRASPPHGQIRASQPRPASISRSTRWVTGGILQQEATKLGLGKVDATATTMSGPGPVVDAILSGARPTTASPALPSLLNLWEKTRGTANEVKAVGNGVRTAP